MPFFLRTCVAICFCWVSLARAQSSEWLSAPKPIFQPISDRKTEHGVVRVHVTIASDGHVTGSTIVKSSGEFLVDLPAKDVVLRWILKRNAVKPSDVTNGRIVEFIY